MFAVNEDLLVSTIHVSIPSDLSEFARQRVEGGEFPTLSAYVEHLLELDRSRLDARNLQQLLQEGIDSGEPIVTDDEWWAERYR
jgi:antitoxin ParD1/3/4